MNSQDRNVNGSGVVQTTEVILDHPKKCFSWSAVIVGALVGMGVSFLLNMFGLAIGLSAFGGTQAGPNTLAVGGFIGLLIITIVSMSSLGLVAGFLGARRCDLHCNYGCLYGFTAWCVALLMAVLLSAQVGRFVALSMAALSNPMSAVMPYRGPGMMHPMYKHSMMHRNMERTKMGSTTAMTPSNQPSDSSANQAMSTDQDMMSTDTQATTTDTTASTTTTTDANTTTNVKTPNVAVGPNTSANTPDVNQQEVSTDDAAKAMALSAFIAFVLFFIGALSATIAGHIAFSMCIKKHSYNVEDRH